MIIGVNYTIQSYKKQTNKKCKHIWCLTQEKNKRWININKTLMMCIMHAPYHFRDFISCFFSFFSELSKETRWILDLPSLHTPTCCQMIHRLEFNVISKYHFEYVWVALIHSERHPLPLHSKVCVGKYVDEFLVNPWYMHTAKEAEWDAYTYTVINQHIHLCICTLPHSHMWAHAHTPATGQGDLGCV